MHGSKWRREETRPVGYAARCRRLSPTRPLPMHPDAGSVARLLCHESSTPTRRRRVSIEKQKRPRSCATAPLKPRKRQQARVKRAERARFERAMECEPHSRYRTGSVAACCCLLRNPATSADRRSEPTDSVAISAVCRFHRASTPWGRRAEQPGRVLARASSPTRRSRDRAPCFPYRCWVSRTRRFATSPPSERKRRSRGVWEQHHVSRVAAVMIPTRSGTRRARREGSGDLGRRTHRPTERSPRCPQIAPTRSSPTLR